MPDDIFSRLDANKQKIDEHRPMREPLLSQLRAYYRIGLTWSSNACSSPARGTRRPRRIECSR